MHALTTTILFLIVLAILVFVHELGHFLAAKKFGIRVDEFGLGFPPRMFGKKYGETVYSLNWIPFGGFVKIFGESPDSESLEGPDKNRSLVAKPRWQQVIVLIAGILFNFIFAWILISFAFMAGVASSKESYAEKYPTHFQDSRIIVSLVNPGSPAAGAGLKGGDVIVGFTSGATQIKGDTLDIEAIRTEIAASEGKPVTFSIKRGEEIVEKNVVAERGIIADKYAVGISMDEVGTLSLPAHYAIYEGGRFTVHLIIGTATGLFDLVVNAFRGEANLSSVTGPVGIAGLVGDAAGLGFAYLCMFTALISINLGVLNLIPFPALDGGRILFVTIEAIRRKNISPKIANTVNAVCFGLLLLLMLIVTFKDVWNLWK